MIEFDAMNHSAMSAIRPPDWKWKRALGAIAGTEPGPSRRWDKHAGYGWIRKAIQFIQRRDQVQTVEQAYDLATRMPDMYWAHKMYSNKDDILRHSLEAHVLAGDTNDEIAARVNYSESIVNTYCEMFYDVRSRLEKRQWIVHSVLGPAVHRGITEREFDFLWKLYGLMMGGHVLDALELKFVNPTRPFTSESVGAAIEDDTISTIKMKANIAAKCVTATHATYNMLLNHFVAFVEIERNSDSAGQAQSSILQAVDNMLTSIPYSVAKNPPRINGQVTVRKPNPVDAYNDTAVELRYDETMQISAGQSLRHEEALKSLDFSVAVKDRTTP